MNILKLAVREVFFECRGYDFGFQTLRYLVINIGREQTASKQLCYAYQCAKYVSPPRAIRGKDYPLSDQLLQGWYAQRVGENTIMFWKAYWL